MKRAAVLAAAARAAANRLSEVETRRRQAMAPYVVHEHSGFYVGRELKPPR